MNATRRAIVVAEREYRQSVYLARVKRQITWSEFYELLALNRRIFYSLTTGGWNA